MIRMFDGMETQLAGQPDVPPVTQLENFLRTTLQARADHRFAVAPADVESMRELFKQHPAVRARLREMRARLEATIRQAQTQGEIDPTLSPGLIVNTLISLQRVLNHPLDQDAPARSPAETAAAIEGLVAFFRRGVGAAAPVPAPPPQPVVS
jgi:hypothetical protein